MLSDYGWEVNVYFIVESMKRILTILFPILYNYHMPHVWRLN